MFHRIFRSLIALATIIVVYQAYVLLAVPLIEPPLAHWQGRQSTEAEYDLAQQSVSRYQRILSKYFPSNHWSLQQPPKIIGNWPVLLVVDNYQRRDNGWIDIHKFALLVFPTPLVEGSPPPSDAVILEAPQGAQLQFDENFRPDRFQIGQIVQGNFPGPITIRSGMHEPGPDDDLLVETADMAMNSKLLYTQAPVRFRMGANVGSGRDLEIRFLNDEPTAAKKTGVSSLEIRRDVQLRVDLKTDRLLPGGPPSATGSKALRTAADLQLPGPHALRGNESPPVSVTCTGPFQFDFVRYVASFDQNVQVRQLEPTGSGDRIDAQQLDIHFAPKEGQAARAAGAADRRQQSDLSHFEPSLVVAQGQPVVVTSPSRKAEARAQRIQLDLRGRRVLLDGGRDTKLSFGSNVLSSPKIEYWHPATDAGTRVGRFRADGPGSLYYVIDPTSPNDAFLASWQKSVELGRSNGQPMLFLDGRPQLKVAGIGSLAADQLTIWFRELVGAPASAGGIALPGRDAAGDLAQLLPDRLAATGQVAVDSLRLSARTEQLTAAFEAVVDPAAGEAAPAGVESAAYSRSPTSAQPQGLAGQLNRSRSSEPPTSSYRVDADRVDLGIRLHGREAVPSTVNCNDHVVLHEISLVGGTQQPFEVRGAKLAAVGLDGDSARIRIAGSGKDGAAQYVSTTADAAAIQKSQLAQLAGRGMSFYTAAIEIDQHENRMWSDGPGQATILVTRDLAGRGAAAPSPFEIVWHNGMVFDGRMATFRGNIEGRGADDSLRCDQLLAKLAAPINFTSLQSRVGKEATDVEEIEFQGQVMIDHFARDKNGPTSHDRLELARLAINQITGLISGVGPGIIRSTQYGGQGRGIGGVLGNIPGVDPADAAQPTAARLNFVRVDFSDRMGGNLYIRDIWFNRRVRAVFGPVDSWEQELDSNQVDLLPPRAMIITCDELRANEDPVAARTAAANSRDGQPSPLGPVQLVASGNVQIDGRTGKGSRFIASGAKATYEQAKKTISLEGDGRVPAAAQTFAQPGGPTASPWRGSFVSYNLETGLAQANLQHFQIDFPQPAQAPNQPQQPAPANRR